MVRGRTYPVVVLWLLAGVALLPARAFPAIYGSDDRREVYELAPDSPFRLWSRSVGGQVLRTNLLSLDDTKFKLRAITFFEHMRAIGRPVSPDERFATQPKIAFCSGFLIAPTLYVTAAHCIRDHDLCARSALVFGLGYESREDDPTIVDRSRVYYCKRIHRVKVEPENGIDFAIVELDRPVTGAEPLKARKEGRIGDNEPLVLIGHTAGLPLKIAGEAAVRGNTRDAFFTANLDSFHGNSGAPVFNATTGLVEGIVLRGERDYEKQGELWVLKRCPDDGGRGEDVLRAPQFTVEASRCPSLLEAH